MSQAPASPIVFETGGPRSALFGDIYFSPVDGLGESRHVFLTGCGLPEAWRGRRRFTVGELGFGAGLNIAALLHLWRREGPANGRLHIFSVEAHPMDAASAARALAPFTEVSREAQALTERWPGRARGFHRVDLPAYHATLDLAVMDVADALDAWTGQADAWFLDGFSPALNPQMWTPEILRRVAGRSRAGARAATFTVAGSVRRGLAEAGFEVDKRPGFGAKRERLEARLPGATEDLDPPREVAIVGAGLAGAALARAFRAEGASVRLFEAERSGAGASGNPAALVMPRLDAGLGPIAQAAAQAFARATRLYRELPGAVIAEGAAQLIAEPRDSRRFAAIEGSGLFEPEAARLAGRHELSDLTGEALEGALTFPGALTVLPAAILQAWTGEVEPVRVHAVRREDGALWLTGASGRDIDEAEVVIVATGASLAMLVPSAPIQPVRGQVSWSETAGPNMGLAWGGYAIRTAEGGVLFGATHDRDDTSPDPRKADDARNLMALAEGLPNLAQRVAGRPLRSRASVRATTPDRLPLAGRAAEDEALYVLGGMGSRGFCWAPLLAEHVAAQALGLASPLPAAAGNLFAPGRFAERAARRGRI